jgi:hypothetical protein
LLKEKQLKDEQKHEQTFYQRGYAESVFGFLGVLLTNYHKLGGINNLKIYFLWFG